MNFHLDIIQDKVEFFEGESLKTIEKRISEQIEINKGILLSVHSVNHQTTLQENGRPYHTVMVHFKIKK